MRRTKSLLLAFIRVKWLKYAIVSAIAVILVGFADENSLYNHMKNKRTISTMESEISKLKAQYEREKELLKDMDRNPRAVEKIARERYFMKCADEDIFVLNTDIENTSASNDEETE